LQIRKEIPERHFRKILVSLHKVFNFRIFRAFGTFFSTIFGFFEAFSLVSSGSAGSGQVL
jgi:hypothetical protein